MGIFDFVKNAGDKILGRDDDAERTQSTDSLRGHLRSHGIDPTGIRFQFKGDTVVMDGTVPNQDIREKAVLIVGNVDGVDRVEDRLQVAGSAVTPTAGRTADFSAVTSTASSTAPAASGAPGATGSMAHGSSGSGSEWSSRTYTVKAGDSLSKIAKEMYGESSKYNQIFEANQPMLKDPDKIYPGQVLRIPAER